MQTISKKSMAITAVLVTLCITLFSFSTSPGAESYKIYINNKLVVEQYVSQTKAVTNLSLTQSNFNDKIAIYYNHCGHIGTSRHILIRDEQNRIVKEWQFTDASGSGALMTFNAKDILALQKSDNAKKLKLFYSSKETQTDKLLATIVKPNNVNLAKL